jgi:hypothetical protein
MIYKIDIHDAGYAEVHCPPAGNELLRHTSAIYDHKRWLIETAELPAFTRWLRDKGHTPVIDQNTAPPQPPPWRHVDVDWDQQTTINAAGVAAARAALHPEQP